MTLATERFTPLIHRLYPRSTLRRVWALEGGVSSDVTALEIEKADGTLQKIVVRRHGAAELADDQGIAAREYKVLQVLHTAGLPVPAPIHLDETGEFFAEPCLVLDYVEGDWQAAPEDLDQRLNLLAEMLARIHRIAGDDARLSFLPRQVARDSALLAAPPAELDDDRSEGLIRAALADAWPPPARNALVLLHGDFWPGNVLWRDERVAAVIDWEDAAVGDPVADVSVTRLELLWAHGAAAMQVFTDRYAAITDVDLTDLACWDLCAALRPIPWFSGWGLSAEEDVTVRDGHRVFVADAMARLKRRPGA